MMFQKALSFGGLLLIAVATIFLTAGPTQAASYNGSPYFRPYTYQYRPITFHPYQHRPLSYRDFQYRPYVYRPYNSGSYYR